MSHSGFAFINVISPCVTFNNNAGSTKSYDYVREHIEATATVDFVPIMKEIRADYEEGSVESLKMHDGSFIQLHKLAKDWNPTDRFSAINAVQTAKAKSEILTGLLYLNNDSRELHELLQTSDRPLNTLNKSELCPGVEILEEINAGFR
jgi:2-oxoglutarate ferredoxin oxidoreductase subunit beta